VVC
jgi:hypothetical protein